MDVDTPSLLGQPYFLLLPLHEASTISATTAITGTMRRNVNGCIIVNLIKK
jgi:hypothetical protein